MNETLHVTDTELLVFMSRLQRKIRDLPELRLDQHEAVEQIRTYLQSQGYDFTASTDPEDRSVPHFFIRHGGFTVALEVQLRAQRSSVIRRLMEYAQLEHVHGLMLLTGSRMRLTHLMEHKPVIPILWGDGWL